MKLGFFGGTFNPPHNGHKLIIDQCKDRFDKFLVIPNGFSPDINKKYSIASKH